MILDLVNGKDPILRTKTEKFDFNSDIDPIELSKNLAETMIANKGLGLAAPQVGLPYRVCVITGQPILAMFNPKIVDQSEEQVLLKEGCLSFPNLYIKVKRPAVIRVRYTRPNQETVTEEFSGLTARIVQHEIDHLEGILFTDRASRFHLEQARKNK
jgi:peptide deformylase